MRPQAAGCHLLPAVRPVIVFLRVTMSTLPGTRPILSRNSKYEWKHLPSRKTETGNDNPSALPDAGGRF
jgi:hypothetical protein